ncbi:MAG: hypothetical protein QUS33_00420 [Dehalococcoidia bacterium]|nr:hypothetical protein [Dehalococcoidia bacterium]
MLRRRWTIAAGVCLLLVIVFGAVFAPKLFRSSHSDQSAEIVRPAHWWKADLNERQLGILQALWGNDATIQEFVVALWPEVMAELPSEMVDAWKQTRVYWPAEDYEDWRCGPLQTMCFGLVVPGSEQTAKCFDVYLGSLAAEETTLRRSTDLGLMEDRCYRVSLYTDRAME